MEKQHKQANVQLQDQSLDPRFSAPVDIEMDFGDEPGSPTAKSIEMQKSFSVFSRLVHLVLDNLMQIKSTN